MKKQNIQLKEKRDKVRHYLAVRRLGLKQQTYHKIMGVKVNGKVDGDLMDWEVKDINQRLEEVKKVISDFQDELFGNSE